MLSRRIFTFPSPWNIRINQQLPHEPLKPSEAYLFTFFAARHVIWGEAPQKWRFNGLGVDDASSGWKKASKVDMQTLVTADKLVWEGKSRHEPSLRRGTRGGQRRCRWQPQMPPDTRLRAHCALRLTQGIVLMASKKLRSSGGRVLSSPMVSGDSGNRSSSVNSRRASWRPLLVSWARTS